MSDSQTKIQDDSESLIWKQFRKRPIGLFSLYVILALFAVAIYAPVLANRDPIALYTTYGSIYEYYYAGWDGVQTITQEAVGERDALRTLEKEATEKYEAERAKLKELTPLYNDAGDAYDKARNTINRLQDQIDLLVEEKRAAEAAGQGTGDLDGQIATLTVERQVAQEASKLTGAEKAKIKKQIDTHREAQRGHNNDILKSRFRLDFEAQEQALTLNLKQLRFPVDGGVVDTIDAILPRYEAVYDKLESAPASELPALSQELKTLESEVESSLTPALVKDALVYRWTFPIFANMDWLDRFFAIGYPLMLLLLGLGRRVPWAPGKKVLVAAAVALGVALVSPLFEADLPQRDFRFLMLDNIEQGYDESVAYMAPVKYGMNENRFEEQYQPPSFVKDLDGRSGLHLLGTDDSGRDVLSRMIWGARVSLSVGFVAVGLHLILGLTIGSLAGFFGGKIDLLLSRLIEIVICFPSFFLILTVIAFIGPSIYNIMIVIGLTGWTGVARLTRGEFLRLRSLDYVIAARASGEKGYSVIFKHVLPNAMTPVLVSAAFGFAGSILIESGLSFLGFGVQEPFPSWGQMLAQGRSNPLLYWWLFIIPGIALFLTVTFYNLAGNAFRDASDPRLRK